jgi:hypothetical protein
MKEVLELKEALNQIALTEEIMFGVMLVCLIEAFFIGVYALIYFND